MAWIESNQEIENHPKTLDLMTFLGVNKNEAIGLLHRFWWWCLAYAEDGDLRQHNDDRLGQAIGVLPGEPSKRFVEAMVKARWLDRKPYFRAHDWWDYAGMLLQIRYKHDPKKWKKVRRLYDGKHDNPPKNCYPNGTPTNQTNQPNQPLSPDGDCARKVPQKLLQETVEAYKVLVGVPETDSKKWDKQYFARCTKSAKALIEFFDADFKTICACMEGIKKWADNGKLDYTLETIVKRMADWKYKRLY